MSDLRESVGSAQGGRKGHPFKWLSWIPPSSCWRLRCAAPGSVETALTNNIANADTPGYQPQEVNFESALQSAIDGGVAPGEVQFQTVTARSRPDPTATAVSIDQESAKLAENGLDYQALTQVVHTRDSIIRSAMGVAA